MRSIKLGKSLSLNRGSPLAWLIVAILIGANIATFSILWGLINSQGQASELAVWPGNESPNQSLLPLPTLETEPTTTATSVIGAYPTATPTQIPTVRPTLEPTAPPPSAAPSQPVAVALPIEAPTQPEIKHVIIISIDGLRPDALAAADTPNLDVLVAEGAYSPTAQTVKVSETLPSHASMLGGMTPEKHGIVWGVPYIGWPGIAGPTLFSVAHDNGLSTAMVFGKEKMNHLILPNSVDKHFGVNAHDPEIRDQAIDYIQAGLPSYLFIHFPDVDRVGHTHGWMSPNQFFAITFVDDLIREILAELEAGGYLDSTLLIVTSDHGGHGKRHGDDSPEDRTIPWLAVGPGIKSGIILSTPINTQDTAATALYALKLPIPENWDGQPVLEIFDGSLE